MSVVGRKQILAAQPDRRAGLVMRSIPDAPAGEPTVPFRMPRVVVPTFGDRVVDIRDFGAKTGPAADCTAPIGKAIEACAQGGGGTVRVPAGNWRTGPIHLRSNIALQLDEGAVLTFIDEPLRYLPPVFVRWGGQECLNFSPLIYAFNCRNVAIMGRGTIAGRGASWWSWQPAEQRSHKRLYQMVLNDVPVNERRFGTEKHPLRPQLIHLVNCSQVLLEDFSISEGGPHSNIHLAYCRSATIRRVRINAPEGPDSDGIVIDSSRNAIVEDCELISGADCISLKSGLNEDGWRVGKPAQCVIIRRVRALGGNSAVTIGSETSGGMRNLLIEQCDFERVGCGIRLVSARGRGGVVEHVFFRSITMRRITGDAIQMMAEASTMQSSGGQVPTFRHIHLQDIDCEQARTAVRIAGLPDRHFQDIRLKNVHIVADEGLSCSAGSHIDLVNVSILPRFGPVFSVKDSQEVLIHGLNNPTENVFLDVRGRQTRNIRLRGEASEQIRPTIVLGIDVPRDALVHE